MCNLAILTRTYRLIMIKKKNETIWQRLIETVCVFVTNSVEILLPETPFFPLHLSLHLCLFRHKHLPLSYRLAVPALCEAVQSLSN